MNILQQIFRHPKLYKIAITDREILKTYHTIYHQENQNLGSYDGISSFLGQHKYKDSKEIFLPVFEYLQAQDFTKKTFINLRIFFAKRRSETTGKLEESIYFEYVALLFNIREVLFPIYQSLREQVLIQDDEIKDAKILEAIGVYF